MTPNYPVAVVKGGGDLATGVAHRLFKTGIRVIITEIDEPMAVRRKVAFSEAVYDGKATVEGLSACLAKDANSAVEMLDSGVIPVIVDPKAEIIKIIRPLIVVDARIAKRNIDTAIDEAPLVIGLGPGFEAGMDVHAVIETCRGPYLGRVIYKGRAAEDTGVPGAVMGYTVERLLRSPADGVIRLKKSIGDLVDKGEEVAEVEGLAVKAQIPGVLRGLIRDGIRVAKGMKVGDVDPRRDVRCDVISDKALAVAGGVLEAVFSFMSKSGYIKWDRRP